MRELELLNGDELDKIIADAKKNGEPIFDENGSFTPEIWSKWKMIFGFKPLD